MSAITVASTVPPLAVVVAQDVIEKIDHLCERAHLMPCEIPEHVAQADVVHKELAGISRQIETSREQFKRPALEYGRAIDAAAKQAQEIIKPTLDSLGNRIKGVIDQENARLEELRAKAAAEALALQAAEIARAEAAQDAAAQGLAPWEDAPITANLPTRIEAAYVPPAMKSSAVRAKTVREVVVFDDSLVPKTHQGVALWALDIPAIRRLALAGVSIPGVRVDVVDGVAVKGTR